jgi:hypothetical protein
MRWCALEIGRDCADVTVMLRDFRSVPEADISFVAASVEKVSSRI